MNRQWRGPGNALQYFEIAKKRWKVDEPYRFGYTLDNPTSLESIESWWHETDDQNKPNKLKSKFHWDKHISESLDQLIQRKFSVTKSNHHYFNIRPSSCTKDYILCLNNSSQLRLRSVTERFHDVPCPLCKDTDRYNANHFIRHCGVFNPERTKLGGILFNRFDIPRGDFFQTIYNPPNAAIKVLADEFLSKINRFETDILIQRKINFQDSPSEACGHIIDVDLKDGKLHRTIIKDYNRSSKTFTIGPSEYSNWPKNDTEVDLMRDFKDFELIPTEFALKFNPITCKSNLQILFCTKKFGYCKAPSLGTLEQWIFDGKLNRCPHKGRIARRYISVRRRGSNAFRQGVT